MRWPAKLIGGLTAAYSAAIIVSPRLLAKPCGLLEADGSVSRGVAVLARGLGIRDLVSGLAMVAAPTSSAVRVVTMVRVASDFGDAIGLGVALPDAEARRKATIVAGGWGLLTLLAAAVSRD